MKIHMRFIVVVISSLLFNGSVHADNDSKVVTLTHMSRPRVKDNSR